MCRLYSKYFFYQISSKRQFFSCLNKIQCFYNVTVSDPTGQGDLVFYKFQTTSSNREKSNIKVCIREENK